MGRRCAGLLLATVPFLLLQGCYQYRVVPTLPPDHQEVLEAATEPESETLHAFFWGLSKQPLLKARNCAGNGFAEVQAKTNLGFVLVSVLTLGVWIPLEVEWRCAVDSEAEEDIGGGNSEPRGAVRTASSV